MPAWPHSKRNATTSKPRGGSQSEVTRGRRWKEQGWGGEALIRQANCTHHKANIVNKNVLCMSKLLKEWILGVGDITWWCCVLLTGMRSYTQFAALQKRIQWFLNVLAAKRWQFSLTIHSTVHTHVKTAHCDWNVCKNSILSTWMSHNYNPSTWKVEAVGVGVRGQPGLYKNMHQ